MDATRAVFIVAALVLAYYVIAWAGALDKSSTFDEPMHTLGAWVHKHTGDRRINFEDPPLFHFWAALPQGPDAVPANFDDPAWARTLQDIAFQWVFTHRTLYAQEGFDGGEAFVARSRLVMTLLGAALVALGAAFAWRLAGRLVRSEYPAGPVAAVVTAGFLAFDATLLAHGPLVKNDVMLTLIVTAICFAGWNLGRRIGPLSLLLFVIPVALAPIAKFNGVLVAPAVVLLLLVRAILPMPWPAFGRELRLPGRLAAAAGVTVLCALLGYAAVWAGYGFTYRASPDGALATQGLVEKATRSQAEVDAGDGHTSREAYEAAVAEAYETASLGPTADVVLWLNEKQLLPEAYLHGFLYIENTRFGLSAFLLGDYRASGWWYYFPVALAFKTPTATLVAWVVSPAVAVGGVLVLVVRTRRRPSAGTPSTQRPSTAELTAWAPALWALAACAVVPATFLASAMLGSLNIGVRHALPATPTLFVAAGVAAAWAVVRFGRPAGVVAGGLVALTAVETLVAWPNLIAFFNAPSRLVGEPIELLGDSNLDWGQDLPALATWQAENPDTLLYFSYFGMADPRAYGLVYVNVLEGYSREPVLTPANPPPGVIAISATHLQAVYSPQLRATMAMFRDYEPRTVLGGSIYLYDFPLKRPSEN
ncbi:MAG: hypothetical protein ACFCVE_10655 [Phycisphaerae bacterium]